MSAALSLGVPKENISYLLLPFYESGAIKKKGICEDDIKIVQDLIVSIRPDQIYAAGDLTDPHGTHRVCLDVILHAINNLEKDNKKILQNCEIFFYRGAWQEWDLEDVAAAVPMSPEEIIIKR